MIITFTGLVSVFVHCENIFSNQMLSKYVVPPILSDGLQCLNMLCEKSVIVVRAILDFEVCSGANHQETRSVWAAVHQSVIDTNPYQEKSYKETCRSLSCLWLIRIEKGKSSTL